MPALAIVADLDVLGDLSPSLLTGFIASMVHQFIVQCTPKAFHRRSVVAVAPAQHRGVHAELHQQRLVVLGTIQGASI